MPAVTCEVDPAGIATVTLSRPEALNALNGEVLDAIREAVEGLSGKARAILVTGAGAKAFVAGADIAEMAAMDPEQAALFSRRGQAAFQALADFEGPVVAAVNGYALGGGLELALACDVIVAADGAVLGQPEVSLAVVPGFGGSQRLPRRVGPGVAKWLLMSGERVKADEALRIGLVDRVVPAGEAVTEARRMLEAILKNGPRAVARAKWLVDDGMDLVLPEALDLEADAFGDLFATADQKEGMAAFLEKRRPSFKGH